MTSRVNPDYHLVEMSKTRVPRRKDDHSVDPRKSARDRALIRPLQHLSLDFRDRFRVSLRARGHVLQPSHAGVLEHLPTEGCRLTELAARAEISKQAMGQLIGELENLGYIECVPDPDDGRAKIVHFSDAGLVLLEDSREIVDEIWKDYAARIGESRLRRLRRDVLALLE